MAARSKATRMAAERERLAEHFAEIEPSKKAMAERLIDNAAFMAIELQELQAEIIQNGATETYQNGANQHGLKASAAISAYNSLEKNYLATIKHLMQMLPEIDKARQDEFYRFCMGDDDDADD